eukprot:9503534-Pyramimonas_sp.AAC.1
MLKIGFVLGTQRPSANPARTPPRALGGVLAGLTAGRCVPSTNLRTGINQRPAVNPARMLRKP